MQIKSSTAGLLKRNGHRLVMLTAALCLTCVALAQGASSLQNPKRITALQISETPDGSRVTVIADFPLDDYEAFRRGDRFYVRIPSADFGAPQPTFQGPGFEDIQVQKVGAGVVISFRLHPGANARVAEGSNRLDVIFTSPSRIASSANAVRSRLARGTTGNRIPGRRSASKSPADIAGPMPPNSPTSDSDITDGQPALASGTTSRTRRLDRSDTSKGNVVSTDRAIPTATPNSMATPYPMASPYSSTYPASAITSTPAPAATVSRPIGNGSSSFELGKRAQSALQWVSTNRAASAGIGVGLTALLCGVIFLLYKRRRNGRKARSNTPRVQPKYSPEPQFEDTLLASASAVSSKVGPGPYVDGEAYESWDDIGSEYFDDLTTEPPSPMDNKPTASPQSLGGVEDESWEFVPANAKTYQGRVQEEREVFEL